MKAERWKQIQGLFEDAVLLDKPRREGYLNKECTNDSILRDEVLALLDANEKSDLVFDELQVNALSLSQSNLPNNLIGPYQIVDKLGSGGMGVVYRAMDLRLERYVALKFLPAILSTEEKAKKRLIREAKAASALDHQNICTIFDIGETPDNQVYIAMAYYEGDSFDKYLQKGAKDLQQSINLALQVTEGLAAAHQKHIFHRDIKPANLILTLDNKVKIVDFGIAKIADIQQTDTGIQGGTIAYMSPEQIMANHVDHRSDIWSTGVILYELISGQKPFYGDTLPEVMHRVLHDAPAKLSSFVKNVPILLEEIIAKALDKNIDTRYQSMSQFNADLKLVINTLPAKNNKKRSASIVNSKPQANSLIDESDLQSIQLKDASKIFEGTDNYPLVGRKQAKIKFKSIIGQCLENMLGQVVYLRGDSGSGKSRLVKEFIALSRQAGFQCHLSQCLEFGATESQQSINSLIRNILATQSTNSRHAEHALLAYALEKYHIQPEQQAFLYDLLGITPPADLFPEYESMSNTARLAKRNETITSVFHSIAHSQPLMIAIEDIHWTCSETIAALAELANSICDHPVIILLTSVFESDSIDSNWLDQARPTSFSTIDLPPLYENDLHEHLNNIAHLPNSLSKKIISASNGNPLMLELILRFCIEYPNEEIPKDIKSIVIANIDRLSSINRYALQTASVIGYQFSQEAIRFLINDPEYLCDQIEMDIFISKIDVGFQFTHEQIAKLIYNTLPVNAKRELHLKVAEWYAYVDDSVKAHHLDKANDATAANAYYQAAMSEYEYCHYGVALQLCDKGLKIATGNTVKTQLLELQKHLMAKN